ncbi:unnamed protein product [Heterobilharzia americana]|nr:unnamed protein product [Heterobilharzia americana]
MQRTDKHLNNCRDNIYSVLFSAKHPDGGFGGGPYQFAHLATSYGAVNCLASLRRRAAVDIIDRNALANWMHKLHQPDGSFIMHIGVAKLTGLLKKYPDLFDSTAEWVAGCQTYEASLYILGRSDLIDIPRLLYWASHRQMATEGGFQGRTNKLVDKLLWSSDDPALSDADTLFIHPPCKNIYCCVVRRFRILAQEASNLSYPSPAVDLLGDDLGNELADLDPLHNMTHDGLAFTLTYFSELDNGKSPESAEQLALAACEKCSIPAPLLIQKDDTKFHNHNTNDTERTVPQYTQSGHTCTTP